MQGHGGKTHGGFGGAVYHGARNRNARGLHPGIGGGRSRHCTDRRGKRQQGEKQKSKVALEVKLFHKWQANQVLL
ncbi:hypothetical protein GCM10027189_11510 [Rufibacter soli]